VSSVKGSSSAIEMLTRIPLNGNGNGVKHGAAGDRRAYPRYQFTACAEALDTNSRSRMSARTSDLSRGGCYVDTFCPFPLHAPVKIRITRERKSFVAQAKVVYSKIGMGMGLQFTEIEPPQTPLLDSWIAKLNGSGEADIACDDLDTSLAPSHKSRDQDYVLGELILTLIRKGVLPADEGKSLLARLL
jgi:hypothetical protein